MITIVDYGMGNVGSIHNMLRHLGIACETAQAPEAIRAATKLILPGVGSFDAGMEQLGQLGLIAPLTEAVCKHQRPILGICLGMQLFTRGSEEGQRPGLAWIAAETRRLPLDLPDGKRNKLPHMGWNTVTTRRDSQLFARSDPEHRYYFVHSYHVVCAEAALAAGSAVHGVGFTAAIEQGPIFGTQFHPEKSHRFGMNILANFAAI